MIELNVEFQEKYKQLDALCKDIFSTKDGVSTYISEMENTSYKFRRLDYDWEYIYRQLKHMRWIRNQLAHEVGAFNSVLCTELDINWLTTFYKSILNRTDPIAKVGQAIRTRQEQTNSSSAIAEPSTIKNETSLWSRIKEKFKSWFS